MTPALLLVTCTLAADPPAAMPAPAPAPVVVAAPIADAGCVGCGGGFGGCGSCATGICPGGQDPNPMEKTGLFAKLKAKLKKPFTGLRKDGCDTCDSSPKLFGRLRGWGGKGDHAHGAGCGCGTTAAGHSVAYGLPVVSGCALPPIPGSAVPTPPAVVPAPLPTAPAGEGKPAVAPNKVSVGIPAVAVPTPMPGKPAF